MMSTERPLRVLIVGATGVFGSRLARLAVREPGVVLTLAGRRGPALAALRDSIGATAVQRLDRDRVAASEVEGFDLVIDCAGPFQDSRTALIEACIDAKVDYADLADGRQFVCAIGRFDTRAMQAGIAIVSGVSSIPALSHAVLDRLTAGWRQIDDLLVGIFPGNRAPRGRSVVEAILSYVGKPVRVFRNGDWGEARGWGLFDRIDCGPVGKRWASVCDTPEQQLLVERFRPTRSAEFVAGLELGILHLGLWLLAFPVRWGWLKSLRPFAGTLLWIAKCVRRLGSDRGAMVVEATGLDARGKPATARWTLDATANLGPLVPIVPALALIRRMRGGSRPQPGAYPCAGLLTLDELEPILDELGIGHSAIPAPAALQAAA